MKIESAKILVVDDERSMVGFLDVLLTGEGYRVSTARNGKQALELIKKKDYDLVLSDMRLGDINGIGVLKAAKAKNPETIVIMISAYSSTENAVEAMNAGAYDFVPKPFDNDELRHTIKRALELKTPEHEKETLSSELKESIHFDKIIGKSPGRLLIFEKIFLFIFHATSTRVLLVS